MHIGMRLAYRRWPRTGNSYAAERTGVRIRGCTKLISRCLPNTRREAYLDLEIEEMRSPKLTTVLDPTIENRTKVSPWLKRDALHRTLHYDAT
jgi:hypothetical protein